MSALNNYRSAQELARADARVSVVHEGFASMSTELASLGIEHIDDILNDLDQALTFASAA